MKTQIMISLLIISIFTACVNSSQKKLQSEADQMIDKHIVFPKSIQIYKNNRYIEFDSCSLFNAKAKIIVIASGDCEKCIARADRWDEIVNSVSENKNISILFFFYTKTPNMLKDHFYPLMKIYPYPIIIDESNELMVENDLPIDDRLKVFLLDNNNKIIVTGDPFYFPELFNVYMKGLSQLGFSFEKLKSNFSIID